MSKRWMLACTVLICTATVFGQNPLPYRDVFTAKIKPEKRADFEAIARKVADANRRMQGDRFIALMSEYGDNYTFMAVSARESIGSVEKASQAFMNAMNEAFTPSGAMKLLGEFSTTVNSSRAEIRRVRDDLSVNRPGTAEEELNVIGRMRYVSTTTYRLRPGKLGEWTEQHKLLKAAVEKQETPNKRPYFISQGTVGALDTIYASRLMSSLAELDDPFTPLAKLLGEDGAKTFLNAQIECVVSREQMVLRVMPEWSNPPDEIVAVAPDYWKPKAKPATVSPKAKTAAAKK
jgi:hypothetical protein